MKAHPFDPFSFAAGLIFTTLGAAAAGGVLTDLDHLRVGWPVLLVVVGLLLVGSTIRPRSAIATGPATDDAGAESLTTGSELSASAPDGAE